MQVSGFSAPFAGAAAGTQHHSRRFSILSLPNRIPAAVCPRWHRTIRKGSRTQPVCPAALPAGLVPLIYLPPLTPVNLLVLGMGAGQAPNGIAELTGAFHIPYSKFSQATKLAVPVPSRPGFFAFYTLGFLASLAGACLTAPTADLLQNCLGSVAACQTLLTAHRPFVVSLLLLAHFAKRELECLFLHKYSGSVDLSAVVMVSLAYGLYAALFIWTSGQVPLDMLAGGPRLEVLAAAPGQAPSGLPMLPLIGAALAAIGMAGNLYHHWLLQHLRSSSGTKEYVIPQGGLFEYVVCPHYTFELLTWLGIALASQHLYGYCALLGMSVYLLGRTAATRRFYVKKFPEFPTERKLLLPFLL